MKCMAWLGNILVKKTMVEDWSRKVYGIGKVLFNVVGEAILENPQKVSKGSRVAPAEYLVLCLA